MFVCMYICMYMCVYVTIISKEEFMNLRHSRNHMGEVDEGREKEIIITVIKTIIMDEILNFLL